MLRFAVASLSVLLLVTSLGCAICPSEFDYDYSAYGGSWDRTDRKQGRVGSAFTSSGQNVKFGEAQTLDEQAEEIESVEGMPADDQPDAMDDADQGNG